jgi:hypothetical protein
MRAIHTAPNRTFAVVTVAVLVMAAFVLGAAGAVADEAPSVTSAAGILPTEESETGRSEVTCASIQSEVELTSSGPIVWQAADPAEKFLDGLSATLVDSQILSWSSDWPITAVIVKGNNSSHLYVYPSETLSDEGLVAPLRVTGPSDRQRFSLTNISRVTFCWHVAPPDLTALCMAGATALGSGEVVSAAGPVRFDAGVVDPTTVPLGVVASYDLGTQLVTFAAPFPVMMAVTHSSEGMVTEAFDPALAVQASGTVHLDDPGTGALVLCGMAATTTLVTPATPASESEPPVEVTAVAVVPTSIASGGGPRNSTLFMVAALFASVAFGIRSLTRSSASAL